MLLPSGTFQFTIPDKGYYLFMIYVVKSDGTTTHHPTACDRGLLQNPVTRRSPATPVKRLSCVVLISGYGSNLQAILDACRRGSWQSSATGPALSAYNGRATPACRPSHSRFAGTCTATAPATMKRGPRSSKHYQPDLIVCAGRMRILSPPFVRRFANKIINLHPALPAMFPGMHSIEAADQAFRARRNSAHRSDGCTTLWRPGRRIAAREVPFAPPTT
ncbi:MAG: hypothetical protein KatS3mg052_2300 [Candidatus Roseilinea sp.]|nr:MAG: hypothetical protein KatS3mg052_2300 [Candidatus Roseilinea sp.]